VDAGSWVCRRRRNRRFTPVSLRIDGSKNSKTIEAIRPSAKPLPLVESYLDTNLKPLSLIFKERPLECLTPIRPRRASTLSFFAQARSTRTTFFMKSKFRRGEPYDGWVETTWGDAAREARRLGAD